MPKVFCAPGNAGTAAVGTNVPVQATDLDGISDWCRENKPGLVVVGPEAPLCAGLVDRLTAEGVRVFGPAKDAARLEGSKIFAKEVMLAAGIPTARSHVFESADAALAHLRQRGVPVVIKADGLAAGKGVTVATSMELAEAAINEAMVRGAFGDAGRRVLVEDCLDGPEASILALIDGAHIVLLASSQDHKRVFDGDLGPNTGGMGAYSPAPIVTEDMWPAIQEQVFLPALREMTKRGIVYKGVLYAGLMMTRQGPRVLEFNCRFGDPETQAILMRWDGDILPALQAVVDGTLSQSMVRWKPEASVCVVMAAGGYPGRHATGQEITGLDVAARLPSTEVFHAATRLDEGKVVTAGGRVLGVTATGSTLRKAVDRAYEACGLLRFPKAHYRRDIAWRAL